MKKKLAPQVSPQLASGVDIVPGQEQVEVVAAGQECEDIEGLFRKYVMQVQEPSKSFKGDIVSYAGLSYGAGVGEDVSSGASSEKGAESFNVVCIIVSSECPWDGLEILGELKSVWIVHELSPHWQLIWPPLPSTLLILSNLVLPPPLLSRLRSHA